MNPILIDVREADEFESQHIEGSIHLPLSTFTRQAPAFFKMLDGHPVVLVCKSGRRAEIAKSEAASFQCKSNIEVMNGGIEAWIQQGRPVCTFKKPRLPIMRQVQLIAGLLILLGVVLSRALHPNFIFLSGFVGLGLTIAGSTGFCGMAILLKKMPWNRNPEEN